MTGQRLKQLIHFKLNIQSGLYEARTEALGLFLFVVQYNVLPYAPRRSFSSPAAAVANWRCRVLQEMARVRFGFDRSSNAEVCYATEDLGILTLSVTRTYL